MSKESKNLGITKSCPVCKNVIVKNLNIDFSGEGILDLFIKCPHCKNNDDKDTYIKVSIQTIKTTKVTLTKVIIPLAFILLLAGVLGFLKVSTSYLAETPWNIAR